METFAMNYLSVILLILTIILIGRNRIFYQRKTLYFSYACITCGIILLLEVFDGFLESIGDINYVWIRKIINMLVFSLTPLVIFFIVLFNYGIIAKMKRFYINIIPLAINFILCFISMWIPLIFSFDGIEYHREVLFFIPSLVSIYYLGVLFFTIRYRTNVYSKQEFIFLLIVLLVVLFSSFLQIVLKDVFLIWSTMAIALTMYYLLLREMQFQYDLMTGMKNRNMFEKDLNAADHSDRVAIIIFDINNLKIINDNEGHLIGDEVIIKVTSLIQETFIKSSCYRIGGDEFVAISTKFVKDDIDKKLFAFSEKVEKYNSEKNFFVRVAYGYAIYHHELNDDIMEVFKLADSRMYEMKKRQKEVLQ